MTGDTLQSRFKQLENTGRRRTWRWPELKAKMGLGPATTATTQGAAGQRGRRRDAKPKDAAGGQGPLGDEE